jgi:hypothetical protein
MHKNKILIKDGTPLGLIIGINGNNNNNIKKC